VAIKIQDGVFGGQGRRPLDRKQEIENVTKGDRKAEKRQKKEQGIRTLFFLIASASILTLSLIVLFLFMEGLPIFQKVSVKAFLLGNLWYPTSEPPDFGIFALIMASVTVTAVASLISIPLGVMTAVYLAEVASWRLREVVKPIVELLAALPSVVIGFFGMVVVAPLLQDLLNVATGLNLFNAALMLAFMSVPTICSISEDAIFGVPAELKEASLALGATHWETIWRVVIPASISGISTAVILGMSRAIGETMVVLMVAGGAAMVPTGLFDPVRPMPASIAAEMAEAPFRGDHYHALFATGIVLFAFTFLFNLVADYVSNRYRQVAAATL
jgi:phosphate transport system permease protein